MPTWLLPWEMTLKIPKPLLFNIPGTRWRAWSWRKEGPLFLTSGLVQRTGSGRRHIWQKEDRETSFAWYFVLYGREKVRSRGKSPVLQPLYSGPGHVILFDGNTGGQRREWQLDDGTQLGGDSVNQSNEHRCLMLGSHKTCLSLLPVSREKSRRKRWPPPRLNFFIPKRLSISTGTL